MRLGRLVAAGLVAGAVAGFVGALLRPRTVQKYRPDTDRPATDARGDLAGARTVAVPASRAVEPVSDPENAGGSQGYALATSARDEATEGLPDPASAATGQDPRTLDVDAVPSDGAPVAAAPSRGANG